MNGKSARTGAPLARAARGSEGHGRALLPCAVLLALVALMIMPTRALADGGGSHSFGGDTTYQTVLYFSEYDGSKQYIVGANSKYDAAAYICGQTATQVASYDDATRYKLSTTENDFSALADSLEKDWPTWNEDSLARSLSETFARVISGSVVWDVTLWDNMTNPLYQGTLSLFQVGYWQNNVNCDIYAVDTTSDAVSRARDDLQEILSGGGDSPVDVPEGYTLLNGGSRSGKIFTCVKNTDHATADSITCDATGTSSIDDIIQKSNVALVCYQKTNVNITYDLIGADYGILILEKDSDHSLYVYNSTDNSLRYTYKYLTIGIAPTNGVYVLPSGGNVLPNQSLQSKTLKRLNTNSCDYVSANQAGGGSDPDPPSGPGNWPDPPSNPTPEPPTVPDPPENPEPDPPSTPTTPTPPPLEPPTNVTIPTGTTPADYTPWLRAILEQLQTLTDELASHCVHLQEEMQQSVNDLTDALIYRFNSLENHIWDLFNGLEDYLHDLAEWLAEQLDFNVNVDPYDDSSVLYWLRQIYGRLGNQPKPPTTVMDPDPTEPFDFWAWLMGLIANTVGGIIGDLVGDVAGLLDLFTDKFPFSIPWDIAALLTLFDGVRATPQFTVRLPAVQGWYDEITFNIDLTPYNSVAAVCRASVNIWWVMCLVMRTDWMLGVMDNATSFGERFARKVARTS